MPQCKIKIFLCFRPSNDDTGDVSEEEDFEDEDSEDSDSEDELFVDPEINESNKLNNELPSYANYAIVTGKRKNSSLYLLDDFLYTKVNQRPFQTFFICQEGKSITKCPARASLHKETHIMRMTTGNSHNHEAPINVVAINTMRQEILDASGTITELTLKQIYSSIVLKNKALGALIPYKTIKYSMRKRREKLFPRLPKDLNDIHALMKKAPKELSKHYRGLVTLEDGTPIGILLAEKSLFKALEGMKEIGYDGTFFVVPKPFYQLWSIHFIVGHHCFPACSILFMGKRTDMYDGAWKFIQKLLKDFSPTLAHQDFELAELLAAQANHPLMKISGCLFHSSSAMFKNHRMKGLFRAWYENPQYRSWLKKCMSVALLPAKFITTAFGELLREAIFFPRLADLQNFQTFKKYIETQWMFPRTKPEFLSVHELENATTSGLESFHSEIKGEIKVHKPNFWLFMLKYNRILDMKALAFRQYELFGIEVLDGERKKKTIQNIKLRRNAELQLAIDKNWRAFLAKVSHTQDTLFNQLSCQGVIQRIEAENNENIGNNNVQQAVQESCLNCGLFIDEKVIILNCRHANVCGVCIFNIINNGDSKCPNPDCFEVIVDTIAIRAPVV